MSFKIRLMRPEDLLAVNAIQSDAYSGHFLESADVIAQRFSLSSDTAWVAEKDGQVCAYLVGYWSKVEKISPLNAPFASVEHANCLYLHDLALFSSVQGFGLAKLLISAATQYAIDHAAQAMALISVQDSVSFWRKNNFTEFTVLDETQNENLLTYVTENKQAFYMVKYL